MPPLSPPEPGPSAGLSFLGGGAPTPRERAALHPGAGSTNSQDCATPWPLPATWRDAGPMIKRAHAHPTRQTAHVRDHFSPGRRQDDADGEAAVCRRCDPSGRQREGAGRGAAGAIGLDEDRAGARHLGYLIRDVVRIRRVAVQPARHAGPRRFLGGHLPDAYRRRQRRHGDRRGARHREPDA